MALFPAEGLSQLTQRKTQDLKDRPGHLFSVNTIEHLHQTPLKSIQSLPGQISVPGELGFPSQCHGSSSTDYSHPAHWLLGASEPRLCSQMGALPVIASICHSDGVLYFFLFCVCLCPISFHSFCFSHQKFLFNEQYVDLPQNIQIL